MDKRIKLIIAFPFIFVIILFAASQYIPFRGDFTDVQERILGFMPSDLSIKEQPAAIHADMRSPFDFSIPASADSLAAQERTADETAAQENALSLIVVSGRTKMAIIRGLMVKEGDSIDGMKIAKIEDNRILLRDKTERWIYLEKRPWTKN